MSNFDSFTFIKNRTKGIEPSILDYESFDIYSVNRVLSMSHDQSVDGILHKTNSLQFSRLAKRQQCMAFTSLDGRYYGGKWALPKKDTRENRKAELQKIMDVFECSRSNAEYLLGSGNLNMQDLDSCYYTVVEPQKM